MPLLKTMLLYGTAKTGKTLLSQAIANMAGANFFNLSPRNTDGKYPGKNVSMLIHMVFKVSHVQPGTKLQPATAHLVHGHAV